MTHILLTRMSSDELEQFITNQDLKQFLTHSDEQVREFVKLSLKKNQATNDIIRDVLSSIRNYHYNRAGTREIFVNKNLTSEQLLAALNAGISDIGVKTLAKNIKHCQPYSKNLVIAFIKRLSKLYSSGNYYYDNDLTRFINFLLKRKDLPADLYDDLMQENHNQIFLALSKSKKLPITFAKKLFQEKFSAKFAWQIQINLMKHSSLPTSFFSLEKLKSLYPSVLMAFALRKDLSKEQKLFLLKHSNILVRQAMAKRPEMIKVLIEHVNGATI